MRALVLSGGGSKGAYQAGALKYIIGEKKTHYDILCGVSSGAINCAFFSMFKQGQEEKSADLLYKIWLNLNNETIYQRWKPWGKWHALIKPSFYDSSPLNKLIKDNIKLGKIRGSGKIVSVGAVSLNSGKYERFTQNSDYFINAVVASASFPVALTPVKFLDQLWVDGGIEELSPIKHAIELGADEIDVIITSPTTKIKKFIENPTTIDVLKRIIELSTDKIMQNDVDHANMYNKLINAGLSDKKHVKINVLRPDENLIEDVLNFNSKKIKKMCEKGYNDAKSYFM